MSTEIGGSPCTLQHDESLVGFTDPGVDFLFTVSGSCYFGAQMGEFFNVLLVFSSNHELVINCSVLPQNLGLLCVDFETNSACCFAKTFSFLLGILVFTGYRYRQHYLIF